MRVKGIGRIGRQKVGDLQSTCVSEPVGQGSGIKRRIEAEQARPVRRHALTHPRDVAHLAAGAGDALAVEMEVGGGVA